MEISVEPVQQEDTEPNGGVSEKCRPFPCIQCNSTFPQSGSLKGLAKLVEQLLAKISYQCLNVIII